MTGKSFRDGSRSTILMTDQLRDELAQAALSTSQAYVAGTRNLSSVESGGIFLDCSQVDIFIH